jgi:hypothetical protein
MVVLPGRTPVWVKMHGRHLAQRLSRNGRVLVADPNRKEVDRLLPGELAQGSVLGNSLHGYPLWTGGWGCALGVRRRRDVAVIVVWADASLALAVVSALVSRLRRERVVLDVEQEATPTERSWPARSSRRALMAILCHLAHSVVVGEPAGRPVVRRRSVVAVCGSDAGLAHTLLDAVSALPDEVAAEWHVRVHVDPGIRLAHAGDVRPGRVVDVLSGEPRPDELAGAELVVAGHGSRGVRYVEASVDSGAAGVIVGHPVAGRVARRADGVWYAGRDPASILVAMESATGANVEGPVSVQQLRSSGDRVVELAEVLA